MKTLILAGGESTRWGDHLGMPKHLVPVFGEPLLHRMVRQLNERGVKPTVVVKPDAPARYFNSGDADYAYVKQVREGPVQEQEGSRHLWDGRTRILYGDCVFSEEFVDAFVKDDEPGWRVYGREGPSEITGKPYGEMLGWVMDERHHAEIDAARDWVVREWLAWRIPRALGWEVYRRLLGFDVLEHKVEAYHFREWNDESDDIDFPEDYEERLARGLA